jgi:mRNA interferase RelE/StbE
VGDYAVRVKPSARKELEGLPDEVLNRVVRKLESLGHDPRPTGCKKLKGYKDYWRIRVGDWRVVYIIDDEEKAVSVTRIAHRRDVYER